jgi:hypothetical protein
VEQAPYDGAVDDLRIGSGNLAGKGVYAAREYAPGEVVVSFELQPLTREQFRALAPGEELFVHSYGGRAARGPELVASSLAGSPAQALNDIEWHVGTGRWEALCSAELVLEDSVGRVSLLLRVLEGNWQVVYEHRG